MPGVPRGGGDSRPPTGSRGECALTTGLTHDPASRTTVPRVTAHGCLLPTSRCAGARRAVVLHQAQTKPIGSRHTDPREPPQHLLRTGGSMGTCCCLTKGHNGKLTREKGSWGRDRKITDVLASLVHLTKTPTEEKASRGNKSPRCARSRTEGAAEGPQATAGK